MFLSNEQRNAYEILKEHARVVIQDKQSSIHNKLTEIAKLQQVCSGFLYSDDGKLVELSNAKLDELLNVIEEIEGKIIIWATFRYSIQKIEETLQKKYGEKVLLVYTVTQRKEQMWLIILTALVVRGSWLAIHLSVDMD